MLPRLNRDPDLGIIFVALNGKELSLMIKVMRLFRGKLARKNDSLAHDRVLEIENTLRKRLEVLEEGRDRA